MFGVQVRNDLTYWIVRAFGNSFSRQMNSAADTKNLLQTGSNASENVFLTRFPYQAANSFADIQLPNALIVVKTVSSTNTKEDTDQFAASRGVSFALREQSPIG
jgi:hypothetical protein